MHPDINSVTARSTFRALWDRVNVSLRSGRLGTPRCSIPIELGRSSKAAKSTKITTSSCTFYKLRRAVSGLGPKYFLSSPLRMATSSRLASCTYGSRSSVKPSSQVIRFPLAASPQALAKPAAASAVTVSRMHAGYFGTGCTDGSRANRASAEGESPLAPDTPHAQPRRRMRRYRAWTDSTRSIVACT